MLIQVVTLIFIVAGVAITLFALISKSRQQKNDWRDRLTGAFESETALRRMEEHMIEMDKTIEEFHSTANSAVLELEEKYQELLFLYSLIDEKKREVDCTCSSAMISVPEIIPHEEIKTPKRSHPQHDEVLSLAEQGLSVPEIAEDLNIGQDMVKLILEIGKAR